MALDFLILYEHTVREYESDLLLKLELERRGYTVRIRQLLDAKDLRLFGKDKPEVLVASCMYDNEAINSHVYNNIGKCNKIVNLQQVTVIPVSNEAHTDYAWEVAKQLRDRGIRVEVDERNEKMQYKIRASQTQKIPYQLIVGDKEMEDGTVNVRRYGQKQTHTETVSEFVENILADIARKSRPDAE